MSLNMKDDEIVNSLMDAGVEFEEARSTLDFVKYDKPIPKEKKSKDSKKETKTIKKAPQKEEKLDDLNKASLGVWQEGILTIINQKLDQINDLQDNLEGNINKKVKEFTKDEINKMKVILDSQRALLISRTNSTLEAKSNEIDLKVNKFTEEINTTKGNIESRLKQFESAGKEIDELQKKLNEQIAEFEKAKNSTEIVIEQIKETSNFEINSLLDNYKSKFVEIDKKLNTALNLASKILESLVSTTKKKIDVFYNEKVEFMRKELNQGISDEKNLKEEIDHGLEKINRLEKHLTDKIDEKVESYLAGINIKEEMETSVEDINRRLAKLEKNTVKGGERRTEKIEELEDFKKQYAALVKKILSDIKTLKLKKK